MTSKEGLRRVFDLLRGQQQGVYGLPGEVLQREAVVDRLEEGLSKARQAQAEAQPDEVGRELIAEALERAAKNKQGRLVDSARHEKATQAKERAVFEAGVLESALVRARGELVDSVADFGEEIVVDHLRPNFDEILSQAKTHAGALEGVDNANAALVAGDEQVRAWRHLEALSARYGVIRRAYKAVFDAYIKDEVSDPVLAQQFIALENLGAMHPFRHKSPDQVPWPSEPVPYLCWLVTSGAAP